MTQAKRFICGVVVATCLAVTLADASQRVGNVSDCEHLLKHRAQILEALELAAEFVEDRNRPLCLGIGGTTLTAILDTRTQAQRIRADAEERATRIEREAAAALKIRAALALLKHEQ